MINTPTYFRKIIKIQATDSPSVRYAQVQTSLGITPTDEVIIPGVLPWSEYQRRLATWDEIRQCIGLRAMWYEGQEILLYPPQWLDRAERLDRELSLSGKQRVAKAIGIDPAEGGDKTAMAAVDELGLIELVSKKTPDTSVITSDALEFMLRHNVPASKVAFDRGGGGKQHADRLRAQGHHVRTVAFGESVNLDPKRGLTTIERKIDNKEDRYQYRLRRSQMYGEFRYLLDPSRIYEKGFSVGFAIPARYVELRRQMAPIPLTYDAEGRMEILPKNRRGLDSITNRDGAVRKPTLNDLIGCSPDELDAVVLAVHCLLHKASRPVAGAVR